MDDPDQLRRKAEACRELAQDSDALERKALWLKRVDEWEKSAIAAENFKTNR